MKRSDFWTKASDYSIAVCALALIAKMFFLTYLDGVIGFILFVGAIGLVVFFVSEFMKFTLRRKP